MFWPVRVPVQVIGPLGHSFERIGDIRFERVGPVRIVGEHHAAIIREQRHLEPVRVGLLAGGFAHRGNLLAGQLPIMVGHRVHDQIDLSVVDDGIGHDVRGALDDAAP